MNQEKAISEEGEVLESGEASGKESVDEVDAQKTKKIKKSKKKNKKKKEGNKEGNREGKKDKPVEFISSTYKTKKCEFYMKGACQKGEACEFSHDFPMEKSKKICKFFLISSCAKGANCFFSHVLKDYPCKFYHLEKKCQMGNNCKFSHSPMIIADLEGYLGENIEFLLELYKYGRLQDQYLLGYVWRYLRDNPQKYEEMFPQQGNGAGGGGYGVGGGMMGQNKVQGQGQPYFPMYQQGNPGYPNQMGQGFYHQGVGHGYQPFPQQIQQHPTAPPQPYPATNMIQHPNHKIINNTQQQRSTPISPVKPNTDPRHAHHHKTTEQTPTSSTPKGTIQTKPSTPSLAPLPHPSILEVSPRKPSTNSQSKPHQHQTQSTKQSTQPPKPKRPSNPILNFIAPEQFIKKTLNNNQKKEQQDPLVYHLRRFLTTALP